MRPFAQFAIALLVIALHFTLPNHAYAQDYTWSVTSGGSWADGTNWGMTAGNFPNSSGSRAFFSSTGNTSAKTVTLDAPITVRRLEFLASQTGSVTIAPGTGGSLTLDSTITGQPTLDVFTGSGNHAISANISLVGPTMHKWNVGANTTLTISGNISGTQGLISQDVGTLLLNGTNTYSGATSVTAGTLGGSGSIASAVTVALGSRIAAGTAVATPTFTLGNGLALNGTDRVTLFSTGTASRLNVTAGAVGLTGASLELVLGSGVTVASMRASGPHSYTIIDAANNQLTGTFATNNFAALGFAASEWTINYNSAAGNAVLNFTPVPEPATVLVIAAIGLIACYAVRRRLAVRTSAVVP
jgi:autotransporter-associated beta strand protein